MNLKDPKPLYLQVANDIEEQITNSELEGGDKLDSQMELARKYDVSLITIKKALSQLIRKGLLYSRVGKGTYVS